MYKYNVSIIVMESSKLKESIVHIEFEQNHLSSLKILCLYKVLILIYYTIHDTLLYM